MTMKENMVSRVERDIAQLEPEPRRIFDLAVKHFDELGGAPEDMRHLARLFANQAAAIKCPSERPKFQSKKKQLNRLSKAAGDFLGAINELDAPAIMALFAEDAAFGERVFRFAGGGDPEIHEFLEKIRDVAERATKMKRGRPRSSIPVSLVEPFALAWLRAKGGPPGLSRRSDEAAGPRPLTGPFVRAVYKLFDCVELKRPTERHFRAAIEFVKTVQT